MPYRNGDLDIARALRAESQANGTFRSDEHGRRGRSNSRGNDNSRHSHNRVVSHFDRQRPPSERTSTPTRSNNNRGNRGQARAPAVGYSRDFRPGHTYRSPSVVSGVSRTGSASFGTDDNSDFSRNFGSASYGTNGYSNVGRNSIQTQHAVTSSRSGYDSQQSSSSNGFHTDNTSLAASTTITVSLPAPGATASNNVASSSTSLPNGFKSPTSSTTASIPTRVTTPFDQVASVPVRQPIRQPLPVPSVPTMTGPASSVHRDDYQDEDRMDLDEDLMTFSEDEVMEGVAPTSRGVVAHGTIQGQTSLMDEGVAMVANPPGPRRRGLSASRWNPQNRASPQSAGFAGGRIRTPRGQVNGQGHLQPIYAGPRPRSSSNAKEQAPRGPRHSNQGLQSSIWAD